MLPTIDEPSLGLTRARLIQDRLSKPDAASLTLPQVVATGKTGSGKSTLGNLLLGATDVLRTTGRIDCTDEASSTCSQRIRMGLGLGWLCMKIRRATSPTSSETMPPGAVYSGPANLERL